MMTRPIIEMVMMMMIVVVVIAMMMMMMMMMIILHGHDCLESQQQLILTDVHPTNMSTN